MDESRKRTLDGTDVESSVEVPTAVETVEVTRVATVEGPVPPATPLPTTAAEEVSEAFVSEHEQVTVEDDGSLTRHVNRVEQRREGRRSPLIPALLITLILALGALAAAWYFTQSDTTSVPAVEGLALNDAVTRVEDDGFKADITNEANEAQAGIVFRQSPPAGTDLEEGSSVQLFSSTGPAEVTVPNTVGVSETEARDRLAAVGLTANVVEVFSDQPVGQVTAQNPAAGTQSAGGAAVRLNVSKGSALTTVPSVVGTMQADAEAQLEAAGLKANLVPVPSQELAGTVVAQNPVSGQAQKGSAVRLNISTGP